MNHEEIKAQVTSFLTRSLRTKELKEDDNILELGLVHSLFMIQLIMFIEKTFHLELEEEDLDMDNIKTVRDLVVLIERYQPTGAEI